MERVEIGEAVLYRGDALEVMADLPAQSVEAIITDPPYCSGSVSEASRTAAKGQGLRSENISRFGWFVGDNMGTAGLVFLLRSVMSAGKSICKSSASALVFCDWRMMPNIAPALESAGWRFQNVVVWNKGSMGLGMGFRAQHEMILHFTNGSPEYHDKGTGNVVTVSRVGTEREHQTQKPKELMASLCRVVSPEDIKPDSGSGLKIIVDDLPPPIFEISNFTFIETPAKDLGRDYPPTHHGKKPVPPPPSKRRKNSMARWGGRGR